MIDLRRLREDPEYRRGIERKHVAEGHLDDLLAADQAVRDLRAGVDDLRARQNVASKEIGRASADERAAKIAAAATLKDELKGLEAELVMAEERRRHLASSVPNPADTSVPDGGEDDGEEIRAVGGTPEAPRLDHAEFGEAMGWVDTEHAAEASGTRFAYLRGEAVLLELGLVNWVVQVLGARGFSPVVPPVLVRERTMEEAGFFPTDRHQVYELDDDDLFLVGTSEVPLSALHRDEIVPVDDLPLRYAGISSCFRREAGTYGKDTKGMFRLHQFDKVEMFSFAEPDSSWDELDLILAIQEEIVGGLGLPYRVVNIAAGDLGAAAAKKFDLEVWLPSEGRYRELTSCSNYLDFSARRLGTRLRRDGGTVPLHTLNGTACAIGRTLVNLFEYCQQPDGSFVVPEVLRPFTGFASVPAPPS
ncbi:MAG: serine--tRNA ligase [Acidimicrobiia bacterium]|nr:serine--tRNA ligase [Acidimicrobiia bacterium]